MKETTQKQGPLVTRKKMRFDTYFTILNAINNGLTTKRVIREKTKISWATCSDIINDLSNLGIIVADTNPQNQIYSPGPKTTVYKFNDHNNLILSMEITPTSINCTIIDLGKNIIFKASYPIGEQLNEKNIFPIVEKVFFQVLLDTKKKESSIIGLVFALTGAIDIAKLQWITTPKIKSLNLIDFSAFRTSFPYVKHFFVEHDSVARANSVIGIQEKGPLNFVFIHISDGVGMTVMNNGRYIRGSRGFANELGHIQILNYDDIKGVQCFCGKTNCLEARLSSKALIHHIQSSYGIKLKSIDELIQKCTTEQVEEIYQAYFELLSNTIVTLSNLYDPETIYIGGKAVEVWYDKLKPQLLSFVQNNSWQKGPDSIEFYIEDSSNPSYGAAISTINRIMKSLVLEILE